jgi:NADH-quinone oxidoreductase subunit L
MTMPLAILAVGAIGAGWVGRPEGMGHLLHIEGTDKFGAFLGPVVGHPEGHGTVGEEVAIILISIGCAVGGWLLARWAYVTNVGVADRIAKRFESAHDLLWNKYYVDELYDLVVIRPTLWAADSVIVAVTDGRIIEGVVNGVPRAIGRTGVVLKKLQTGLAHHYALWMALGLIFISLITFMR